MKRGRIFVAVLSSILLVSSFVNADIALTVNGLNSSAGPLEFKSGESISIGLSGGAELTQKKYDLTITATGGTLEDSSLLPSTKSSPSDIVQINVSSLDKVGEYLFSFTSSSQGSGLALINLFSNQDMIIDDIDAAAGTKIYELAIFSLPETNEIVAFGINYNALYGVIIMTIFTIY